MIPSVPSPYTWLLAALVLIALGIPLLAHGSAGVILLNAFSTALIAASVAAVARERRHLILSISLAVPAVTLTIIALSSGGGAWAMPQHAVQTVFFGYTACVILADVLRDERITAEKIRGAVCVFLLIGGTWAFAYMTLQQLDPASFVFNGPAPSSPEGAPVRWPGDILYFSLITLTSTGYGDILPASAMARTLASLEATLGQMYVAILVARLVGLHVAQGERES